MLITLLVKIKGIYQMKKLTEIDKKSPQVQEVVAILKEKMEELRKRCGNMQDIANPNADAIKTAMLRGQILNCSILIKEFSLGLDNGPGTDEDSQSSP